MLFLSEITQGSRFRLYALGTATQTPAHEFLTTVRQSHPQEWAKLMARLEHSAENGPPRNPEQCRKLKGGSQEDTVFEFKTHKLRLFWFYDEGSLILCANGLLKGTRKEQDQAITTARQWKADYFSAKVRGQVKIISPT